MLHYIYSNSYGFISIVQFPILCFELYYISNSSLCFISWIVCCCCGLSLYYKSPFLDCLFLVKLLRLILCHCRYHPYHYFFLILQFHNYITFVITITLSIFIVLFILYHFITSKIIDYYLNCNLLWFISNNHLLFSYLLYSFSFC